MSRRAAKRVPLLLSCLLQVFAWAQPVAAQEPPGAGEGEELSSEEAGDEDEEAEEGEEEPEEAPAPAARPDAGARRGLKERPPATTSTGARAVRLTPPPRPAPVLRELPIIPVLPATRPAEDAVSDIDALVLERIRDLVRGLYAGDNNLADLELVRLMDLRAESGVRNIPLASMALVHFAGRALSEQRVPRAQFLADAAARLSPDLEAPHWMRAQVSLARPAGGSVGALEAALSAISASSSGVRNRVARALNVAALMILVVVGLWLAFALLQLLSYGRCMAKDLSRFLPPWAGWRLAAIVFIALSVSLFAAGVGLAPLVALWLLLLAAYQDKTERVVGIAGLAALALLPVAADFSARLLHFSGSRLDGLAVLASELPAAPQEQQVIKDLSRPGETDPDAAFLLGARAKGRGDLAGAERWYRQALKADPSNTGAHNNLGVVLFLQHQPVEAMEELGRAAHGAPALAEAYLNQANIYLDQSRFDDAKRAIDSARAIDASLTARFGGQESSLSVRERLLDRRFDEDRIWLRLMAAPPLEHQVTAQEIWGWFGGTVPAGVSSGWAALALVLSLLIGRKQKWFSTRCERCGAPAVRSAVEATCDECTTIFVRGAAAPPPVRMAQERAVRVHRWWETWGPRILAPIAGLGHLASGRAIEGSLLFGAFTLVLGRLLWAQGLSVNAWSFGLGVGTIELYAGLALAGLLSLISIGRVLNH